MGVLTHFSMNGEGNWFRVSVPMHDVQRTKETGETWDQTRIRETNMAACHIRKNLAALRQFPRVALNNIRDLPEAFKPVGTLLSLQVKRVDKSFKI